jgi:hypothetical protein
MERRLVPFSCGAYTAIIAGFLAILTARTVFADGAVHFSRAWFVTAFRKSNPKENHRGDHNASAKDVVFLATFGGVSLLQA